MKLLFAQREQGSWTTEGGGEECVSEERGNRSPGLGEAVGISVAMPETRPSR